MMEEKISISLINGIIASCALQLLAVTAVSLGSFLSVAYLKKLKETGEPPESEPISFKDALKSPFKLSAFLVLFFFYLKLDKSIQEDQANHEVYDLDTITICITTVAVRILSELMTPLISILISPILRDVPYHLSYTRGAGEDKEHIINKHFTKHDVVSLICCAILGVWYYFTKNWFANNLLGYAMAVTGIKHAHINNMLTGCILLMGLLFYDVFWVFATDVMITVATSIKVPALLIFPSNIIEEGLFSAKRFSMLGLGDIAVPGIIISFLLRFDLSLKRNSLFYFYSSLIAYVMALSFTATMVYVFSTAQPALLYIVPVSLSVPLFLAYMKGDIRALFQFEHQKFEENNDSSSSPMGVQSRENNDQEIPQKSDVITPVGNKDKEIKKDK